MGRAGHFYREFSGTRRWTSFRVKVETSDIYVRAYGDFSEVMGGLVEEARRAVRSQIERQESFLTSFDPVPRMKDAHPVVEAMYRASEAAGVGPMAAVAGAIAEYAGRALLERSPEVLVENGGDIWLSAREAVTLAVYAGGSRFTGNLGIRMAPESTPAGVCTSSGRVGPSFSFGRADAATVIARRGGWRAIGNAFWGTGFVAAVASVAWRGLHTGHPPMQNLFEFFLSMAAALWPLSVWSRWRNGLDTTVQDALLGMLILVPAGFVFGEEVRRLPPALHSALFIPHVGSYVAGYVLLARAALMALPLFRRDVADDRELRSLG